MMKQPTFGEFGIIGAVVGRKRATVEAERERWYCEGSGRRVEHRRPRTMVACPECSRIVSVTLLGRVPNHNRQSEGSNRT
jgi:hypothetical protein